MDGGVADPNDYSSLKVHPGTGLDLIDIPAEYESEFPASMQGSIMHWFSNVKSVTKKDTGRNRFLLITDNSIFILKTGGVTDRSNPVAELREVLTSRDNDIGIRFQDSPTRYDIMVITTAHERDKILAILKKLYTFHVGSSLPHRHMDPASLSDTLLLRKPEGWKLKVEPLITKKVLMQKMAQQQEEFANEKNQLNEELVRIEGKITRQFEQQISQRNEEFANFKVEYQNLQMAHNNLVIQYDAMAQDIDAYVELLNSKDEEIERFKAGDHPRIRELEHQVEKLQLQKEIEDVKYRGDTTKEIQVKDQEIRFQGDLIRQREQTEQQLTGEVRRREEELQSADQALREKDNLLHSKQLELEEKEKKLAEKERELRYTKSLMRSSFKKQVAELDLIRSQFQQYDDQIIGYITKIFSTPPVPGPGGSLNGLDQITKPAFTSPPPPGPTQNYNTNAPQMQFSHYPPAGGSAASQSVFQ